MQFILTFVIWGWRFYTINAPCAHQTNSTDESDSKNIFTCRVINGNDRSFCAIRKG